MRTILSQLRIVVNCRPATVALVLVVSRFVVPVEDGEAFRAELAAAHAVLAERPGYVDGRIGRNLDDPTLWVLTTRWDNVGAYRRALSSYDVKLHAVPLLSRAVDEPSAYEVVEPGTVLNIESTRSLG
jgi:antibiotic biosynthesis monooxygenase (ABM) superfamily enzyme